MLCLKHLVYHINNQSVPVMFVLYPTPYTTVTNYYVMIINSDLNSLRIILMMGQILHQIVDFILELNSY